ncbi:MAG TPA: hypothetical protein VLG49_04195, partial [Rhabdochlamydiaceae bacterium]|nr:hypothetical protein [Rhabdochlamydiaceae bacterium]
VIFFELELENINFSYLLAGHRSMAIPVGSCDYSSKITFQLRKEPIVQQMIEKKDFDDEGNTIFKYVKADPDSFTYWKLIDTEINIKNCKLDPDVLNPEKIQVRS